MQTRPLAKILSAYLLATGIGFLVSADFYNRMIAHTGSDPVLINLSGMVHFFIGITILVLHFRWRGLLPILVSLLGAMYLLKGSLLIAVPELTLQSGGNTAQLSWVTPAGFLAFGILLGALAFFGKRK